MDRPFWIPAIAGLVAFLGIAASDGRSAHAAIPVPEPPAIDGRLRIPSIGVDAPLGPQLTAPDGTMPMPHGPVDVAWYDFSLHPGLGGVPGLVGNAIVSGHVDYAANVPYAGVRYSGPAVFAGLGTLQPGARIEVVRNGRTVAYRVVSVEVQPAETADWLTLFASTPVEMLTLFTCTGDFNPATVSYSDRVVVQAVRVLGEARRLDVTADGRFLYGTGGTSDPRELAAAQPGGVSGLYARDPVSGEWLTFVPGAPAFINTLTGRLRPDALVVACALP
jgi:sortase (surface protein transpeptidase)